MLRCFRGVFFGLVGLSPFSAGAAAGVLLELVRMGTVAGLTFAGVAVDAGLDDDATAPPLLSAAGVAGVVAVLTAALLAGGLFISSKNLLARFFAA
jgi:hypothetical protein